MEMGFVLCELGTECYLKIAPRNGKSYANANTVHVRTNTSHYCTF